MIESLLAYSALLAQTHNPCTQEDPTPMPLTIDLERLAAAIEGFCALDGWTWSDIGPSLCCSEANAVAELYRVFGRDDLADTVLTGHAGDEERGDDEGDDHYHLRSDISDEERAAWLASADERAAEAAAHDAEMAARWAKTVEALGDPQ